MQTPFISLNSVLDRIYAHPMMAGLPNERAIAWAVDVIRLIGSREFLVPDVLRIKIDEFRGPKPLNMVFVKQVRKVVSGDDAMSMWSFSNDSVVEYQGAQSEKYESMYEATDSFHEALSKTDPSYDRPSRSYTMRGNYIYVGFESGVIDIAFDKIPIDGDGLPMIPNDPSIEKAIESYIKSQYFTILFDLGKDVSRARDLAETEYCWYIGQSQSKGAAVTIDKRESISNVVNRLMLNDRPHDSFFNSREYPEKMIKH